MANRPRSLVRRPAGTGLEAGSGGTLDVDLNELSAKTVPVMADSVALVDSSDNSSKVATLTNCLKILGETAAGVAAASGLTEVDGVLKVAPTDEILVPATGYLLTQNAAGAPHKDAVADIVALVAGTPANTGLAAAAGVLTVTPSDATINIANDSIQFVTQAGLPKKEAVTDFITLIASGKTIEAAAGILKVKAGCLVHLLKDGTDAAANVSIAAMAVGDELISVHAQAPKASVATITDRTSEYAVGAGVLTKSGGTDERSNQLDIWYWDRT